MAKKKTKVRSSRQVASQRFSEQMLQSLWNSTASFVGRNLNSKRSDPKKQGGCRGALLIFGEHAEHKSVKSWLARFDVKKWQVEQICEASQAVMMAGGEEGPVWVLRLAHLDDPDSAGSHNNLLAASPFAKSRNLVGSALSQIE